MNSEQIERAIQFLLDNQANYEVRQAEYEARQTEYNAHLARLEQTIEKSSAALYAGLRQMHEGIEAVTAVAEKTMLMVEKLAQSQMTTIRRVERLENRLDNLA